MNRLHVYTGSGKGKTTAAMGLALRSAGHGNRVLVCQFLKDGASGELQALGQLSGVTVRICPMQGFAAAMDEAGRAEAANQLEQHARSLIHDIALLQPDTIILDEIGMALSLDMLAESTARALIAAALRWGETVVTGYYVPSWLTDAADYVTCMEARRHPYETESLPARKGVEW